MLADASLALAARPAVLAVLRYGASEPDPRQLIVRFLTHDTLAVRGVGRVEGGGSGRRPGWRCRWRRHRRSPRRRHSASARYALSQRAPSSCVDRLVRDARRARRGIGRTGRPDPAASRHRPLCGRSGRRQTCSRYCLRALGASPRVRPWRNRARAREGYRAAPVHPARQILEKPSQPIKCS